MLEKSRGSSGVLPNPGRARVGRFDPKAVVWAALGCVGERVAARAEHVLRAEDPGGTYPTVTATRTGISVQIESFAARTTAWSERTTKRLDLYAYPRSGR